jgi:hypothetical protein
MDVDLRGIDPESVPGPLTVDGVAGAHGPQRSAKFRHPDLQCVDRVVRLVIRVPQRLDQRGQGHRSPGGQHQDGQERTLPVAGQSLRSLGGGQLERTEQTHLDLGHQPARVRTQESSQRAAGRDKARDDI